jgi:branched-chain amino acid transport system permease protein
MIPPVAILLFFCLLPLVRPQPYLISFLLTLFMFIALSESWNIIGSAGYISFGHVTFFGVGAYTTSLFFLHLKLSPFLTAPVAGFLASVVAVIFGYPCLRLRGPYFTITTFCMSLAVQAVVMNLRFTGMTTGFWLPLPKYDVFTGRLIFYEVMLGLLAVIIFIVWHISRSKFGLALASIREEEDTAQTLGVNVTRVKMTAFTLSAFLTGVVGGIYAYYRTYVNPDIMFDLFISISVMLMCLLGGTRSIIGPVLGALIVTALSELFTGVLGIEAEYSRIIYGLILALVIMFLPNGIMSLDVARRLAGARRGE